MGLERLCLMNWAECVSLFRLFLPVSVHPEEAGGDRGDLQGFGGQGCGAGANPARRGR